MNPSEFCEFDLITFGTPIDQEIVENILFEEGLVQKKQLDNEMEGENKENEFVTRQKGEMAYIRLKKFLKVFTNTSAEDTRDLRNLLQNVL